MPVCPQCGNKFSGFSFGSNPASECKDCRTAKAEAGGSTPSPEASALAASGIKASTPFVTLTLIALNVLVFVAMGLSGASWTDPTIEQALRWGADFGPLTLSGEWWRALTSTFVHFGIIHIGFNMWCLWSLGRSLEIFMGRKAFAMTYLLSGLMASLVSIAWNPWRVSAGASGAIFGIAGAFVTYLYMKKVPMDRTFVRQKLKDLAIFIGYNLLYGAAGNVDNSAHLGGLVSGLVLGVLVPPMLRQAYAMEPTAEPSSPGLLPVSVAAPIELTSHPGARMDRLTLIGLAGCAVLLSAAMWIYGRNIPAAHYGRAITLVKVGQTNNGVAELEQSVALNSSLYFPSALLGELRLEQGNSAAAVPILEHTMRLVPAYSVAHNLALAYIGAGRPTDAIEEITGAMKFEMTDPWRAQYILALAEMQSGDSQHAAENFRLVIQSKPDLQEARDALALLDSPVGSRKTPALSYPKFAFKSKSWPIYP
jgi:membrane associated rhomboid family serine protease